MRIHHLNCGTMRPYGGRLVSGTGSLLATAEMICHCLLVEADHGLVVVDTGYGTDDVRNPDASLTRSFRRMARPVLAEPETALRQVEGMGFRAEDVRDIVLTHLDLDHAGGLRDFPDARVHVCAASWRPRGRHAPRSNARATRGPSGRTGRSGSRTTRAATTGSASPRSGSCRASPRTSASSR
jgi:glyoxylase-like metal-dependent hydrolase (beta-lactamase superfamily II)